MLTSDQDMVVASVEPPIDNAPAFTSEPAILRDFLKYLSTYTFLRETQDGCPQHPEKRFQHGRRCSHMDRCAKPRGMHRDAGRTHSEVRSSNMEQRLGLAVPERD